MLEFFNHRKPNLKEYQNLSEHLKYEFANNFAHYYTHERNEEKLKNLDESLKLPLLFRYWRNSLD